MDYPHAAGGHTVRDSEVIYCKKSGKQNIELQRQALIENLPKIWKVKSPLFVWAKHEQFIIGDIR
jgi:hypothetical protein